MTTESGTDNVDSTARETWLNRLIADIFKLMHHFEQDNFDSERYPGVPSNTFFYDRHAAYFAFFLKHVSSFFDARQLLCDEQSKEIFDQLILFRILGHLHVRLPFNTPEATNYHAITDQWKIEDTQDKSSLGTLAIFAVPFDEGPMRLKCWAANVAWTFLFRQYFYARGGEIIAPASGDGVIDAGGCFGDTALSFAREVGSKGHVHTFDPLKRHCAIMRESFAMNTELAKRISIYEVGLADKDDQGSPNHARDMAIDPGARISVGGDLPTRTIDSLVAEGAIDRIDFIKMDIEGSELPALIGAESALRRWRPKLALFSLPPARRFLRDSDLDSFAGMRISTLSSALQHSP